MKLSDEFWDEWHAWWIGFAEGATYFRKHKPMPLEYNNPLKKEWHHYMMGRPAGCIFITIMIIGGIIGLLKLGGLI